MKCLCFGQISQSSSPTTPSSTRGRETRWTSAATWCRILPPPCCGGESASPSLQTVQLTRESTARRESLSWRWGQSHSERAVSLWGNCFKSLVSPGSGHSHVRQRLWPLQLHSQEQHWSAIPGVYSGTSRWASPSVSSLPELMRLATSFPVQNMWSQGSRTSSRDPLPPC